MGLRVTDRTGQHWTYSTATYWTVEENGSLSLNRRNKPGDPLQTVAQFAATYWVNVELLEALPAAA